VLEDFFKNVFRTDSGLKGLDPKAVKKIKSPEEHLQSQNKDMASYALLQNYIIR
jgi:hypothetical protein